ncbi:dTDP-glucose 4%2C6-dehydratase [uncultured Roseburia sp.]|uniref:NAD-dependent epimerase/dehydratase family protein n=1 Tax=Brotonthovivens ammoniilytica TaxID=2981725 RepID=A0ABT2TM12_9FIRM|nr:NAD-dependent epimerase/dehydratase family protein [Brotonthovivens ammoniilytica]MCU6762677.1 NAD-dependent epimerase/dehydratase family protein [Brotonthovivens ammoniilytica]SCI84411.1 dTDP-glucose 4%2C6-dehydratase [uncultured Roseburia sp.]
MNLLQNEKYIEDIRSVAAASLPWERLSNSSFLITGAGGMIGSFLIDVLMYRNQKYGMNCKILAFGRSVHKAEVRFRDYWEQKTFEFTAHDINLPLGNEKYRTVDYILHAASNTHPVAYATDPIGTVTTNVIGTNNLLDFACRHKTKKFVFASTVEVYGENQGDTDYFKEDYCGYINCNTLRAGYPESKRCGEALCQAYRKQRELDVVIPRLARTYGPTMLSSDTKAISQFLKKGAAGENIILKSEGTQLYSYTYVADAVSGILYTLFYGKAGEAYNVADTASDIMLKDLAGIIAEVSGTKVVFELPDAVEAAGYSKATKALMDGEKIRKLGWKPGNDIKRGLCRTLEIFKADKKVGRGETK